MNTALKNLKGLNHSELTDFVGSIDEKSFRAKQLFQWIYQKNVHSFDEMTNLSKTFRQTLEKIAIIQSIKVIQHQRSKSTGTQKLLFELDDGLKIEAVLIPDGKRRTVCLSTQVGCPLACSFCATGLMGLKRNLTVGEIIDQLLYVQSISDKPITNIVFMGMGEPFLNYENTLEAAQIISDDLGPSISSRRVIISTVGLVPEILRFADDGWKFRLAISLHATTDEQRSKMMPINKKYPIAELMDAARYYSERSKDLVTFEYVLLNGINDSVDDAKRLSKLIEGLHCKINLIEYNPTVEGCQGSSEEQVSRFMKILLSTHATITLRRSKGDDIDAACGQLYAKN